MNKYNMSPILGRGKCSHCGNPVSTALPLWMDHMKNCPENPDNTNQDKSNMERINQLDFDPVIITKKDVVVIGATAAALTALAALAAYKGITFIKNKIKG